MKLKEIKTEITRWIAVMRDINSVVDSITGYTCADPESPMMRPICETMSAYTNAVSRIIGDDSEFLIWYWLECDMGREPHAARVSGDADFTMIKTPSDLARIIYRSGIR